MSSDSPEKRLDDILVQIARIESHVANVTHEQFLDDPLVYDAVERCLERICEAARKIGTMLDEKYPEVKFKQLRDFGSILRHDYDAVLPDRVWLAVTDRLPLLKAACRAELGL
jgi:uncharacterized protein with HEPN domain